MQTLKETLFYSNFRTGWDRELVDDDRELLVQEQKSSRARARKFSSETNRRRKALEERRKQWDVEEERLREKILQQRKQRVEDATERFQRAHLPPSQRRRQGSAKRVPNLEEALNHIHGALGSYPHQSSFTAINRSSSPTPKPPGGSSGPGSLQPASAAEAYAKLLRERGLSEFKNSQLFFLNQLQDTEDQQQDCPQEPRDTPPSATESLSSLDSLDNQVPQEHQDNIPACSSSCLDLPEVQDVRRPPSLQPTNHLRPPSVHCPPMSFLEEVLSQQNSSSSSSISQREDSDSANEDQTLQDLIQAAEQCNLIGQSEGCHNEHGQRNLGATSGHIAYYYDSTALGNISRDNSTVVAHCKTHTASDTTPLEFTSLTQESKSQRKTQEEKYAQHPQVTVDVNTASPHFDISVLQAAESESSSQSWKKKPEATVLLRETQPENYEKCKKVDPSSVPDECSDRRVVTTSSKSSKTPEEPDRTSTAPKCRDVRFLKGILKKNSKYVVRDARITYTTARFVFPKQVATSIRDSMELTRVKAKEPERDKSVKKKLRWLDQVNDNSEGSEERMKEELNKPIHPPQQAYVDHQGYMNAPTTISSTAAGPSSTRQAWADVQPQEEPTEEPKLQRVGPHIAGPRVPRRVRSARTGSGAVTPRVRKGTVIRPQSANEARRVLRTQGKTMVPRPPPRSEVLEANSTEPTVYITKMTYNKDSPQSKAEMPHPQPVLKADEGAVSAPAPPSYAYAYETVSEGIYALCQQPDAQTNSARRPVQHGEKGICLDRTPTDEEISLLWRGVRSALASKEGDPQSFLTHNGSLSTLPQGRANLSHVTISGDSLLSGVKAVTRTGGFFLSPSSARTPVRRPTVESNMVKNRIHVDPNRAPGDRKHHFLYQATVPINDYLNKTDRITQDEGVVNGDGLVAVDMSQLQKAGVVLQQQQRGQVFGLSALSLEEQRLLQSLDKLNHRLQYVKDMAARNTALKGIYALNSANNLSPQTGEVSGATQRRYHTAGSAENRTRSHKL